MVDIIMSTKIRLKKTSKQSKPKFFNPFEKIEFLYTLKIFKPFPLEITSGYQPLQITKENKSVQFYMRVTAVHTIPGLSGSPLWSSG